MSGRGATLLPEKDVARVGEGFVSFSSEPWLRLSFAQTPRDDEWMELVYEADFAGEPTRPLLRAIGADGESQWILPAPVLGRALWQGRAPSSVTHWSISPVDRTGAFDFRVVRVRTLSLVQRLALCGSLSAAAVGLWLTLTKTQREADTHFRRRLMATRLSDYRKWRRKRRAAPDLSRVDRADASGDGAPHIRFVRLSGDAPQATAPVFDRVGACSTVVASASEDMAHLAEGLDGRDLLAFVRPGDEWVPETADSVSAAVSSAPFDLLYADEEIVGATA